MTQQPLVLRPQKGRQEQVFQLAGDVDFLVIGGSRFGGKSTLVSMIPLIYKDDPNYNAIVFRREFDQLMGAGGLWEMASEFYPPFGASAVKTPTPTFTFPSNAKVRFKHMYTEADAEKHRGLQYSTVIFEEITQFSKEQVQFLLTCLRSEADMNSFCIGTCNPDPDSWLLELLDWYIDPDTGLPIKERQGCVRYFVVIEGDFVCADDEEFFKENYPDSVYVTMPDTGEQLYVPPKKFSFLQLSIFDNPLGMKKNPRYMSELQNLPDHEREKQLWGNWYARPKGTSYFQREWLVEVDSYPMDSVRCRAWDKAGTEPNDKNKHPDFTAGSPRLHKSRDGYFYLVWDFHHEIKDEESQVTGRFRKRAGDRDNLMMKQAEYDGHECTIVMPQDPGSAGKTEYEYSAKKFTEEGFKVAKDPMPANKSKLIRAEPFFNACQNGLVRIVKSSFPNETTYNAYMKEMESFDGESRSTRTSKDDWVDATASAFNFLCRKRAAPMGVCRNQTTSSTMAADIIKNK